MDYQSVLVLHTIEDSLRSLEAALTYVSQWRCRIDVDVFSSPKLAPPLPGFGRDKTPPCNAAKTSGTAHSAAFYKRCVPSERGAIVANSNARLDAIRRFTQKHDITVSLANHICVDQNVERYMTKSALVADLVIMDDHCPLLRDIRQLCLDVGAYRDKQPVLLTVNSCGLLSTEKPLRLSS